MSGPLLMNAVRESGATLLPIDSEHNAIFQCLPAGARTGEAPKGVRRILLTASGGPFRDWQPEAIAGATPEAACAHPNWVMGRKISVDSATLMNKGLELIEACFLFALTPDRVEIVVHPQSIIHSLVEYLDGSVLAQLGSPDMRTPIACALSWPERMASGVEFLDLVKTSRLDFRAPDPQRFRCLALAQAAARAGGLTPVALNAANEVAVHAFLERRLNFPGIAAVIEEVVTRCPAGAIGGLDDVLAADAEARRLASERIDGWLRAAGGRRSRARGHEYRLVHTVVRHRRRAAGHHSRVRPLLGRAAARLQGAPVLGRLRTAALVAARGAGSDRDRHCAHPARRLRQAARRARGAGAAGGPGAVLHPQAPVPAHRGADRRTRFQHPVRHPGARRHHVGQRHHAVSARGGRYHGGLDRRQCGPALRRYHRRDQWHARSASNRVSSSACSMR